METVVEQTGIIKVNRGGTKKLLRPDYIFETSWEVCNKVGGIHTVIATKTLSIVEEWGDNYILIGPDVWKGTGEHPEFAEDPELFKSWKAHLIEKGLKVRIGRWKIAGNPLVVLVDFTSLFPKKNEIFKGLWLDYKVDSLTGGWDYIEPALFGYAAGQVIECFYQCHLTLSDHVVAHFHEWLTAAGILYLEKHVPQIATLFTTHATVAGRTIAGNELPFYGQFDAYNAEQIVKNWNIVAKHSLEKAGANNADCFTTVSEITAKECTHFLEKTPDVITPNGFDDTIAPASYMLKQKRKTSRTLLHKVAQAVTDEKIDENCFFILKSGRYEFRNKGIDVFIQAMGSLDQDPELNREIVAFICIPSHQTGPRKTVVDRMAGRSVSDTYPNKFLTHHLQGAESDPIVKSIELSGLKNDRHHKVKVIFVPVYLDGNDGIFNRNYYDLLPGFDLSVFPSYYEPWGYTPLESLAFHVPTITTDVAGFGQFISGFNTGVYVLHRDDDNKNEVAANIVSIIKSNVAKTEEEAKDTRQAAYALSKVALWKNLIVHYKEAFDFSLNKTQKRSHRFEHEPNVIPLAPELEPIPMSNQPVWRKIFIQPTYPDALKPLEKLARNLWWSWNQEAVALFESVDTELWKKSGQNPLQMLSELPLFRIRQMSHDTQFLNQLNVVYSTFKAYINSADKDVHPLIAYFCMEYGLENNLKLYSGGLGILAGDYLKQASDSNKNVIGVGLLYRNGYFRQKITLNGDQLAEDDVQKFTHLPMEPVRNADDEWLKINIAFPGRTLYAKAWRVPVGRASLYLLDTDIPENRKEDRAIANNLYSGDLEHRLKQEILLGIGGIRLLNSLNIHPDLYHCNEGHAAFTSLERIYRNILERNIAFNEAYEVVKASTLFTTHTPVDAAHERFTEELLRGYLSHYTEVFNIPWEQLMALGRAETTNPGEKFSMSYLAARMAQEINGVSKINEAVSKNIFHTLWKSFTQSELHIGHVTNGVHYATWVAPEWHELYKTNIGTNPEYNLTDTMYWKKIQKVPDAVLWEAHVKAKNRLINLIRERFKAGHSGNHNYFGRSANGLHTLTEKPLIIGFARRFVPYKRSLLLFQNIPRLENLINNTSRPVVILFAGKAHPNDLIGQQLIKRIVTLSYQKAFLGKIIFLEDYDITLAKCLVQGVDLWLNTPERGMEASGTSGMKAMYNGVLNFSVMDGWWSEAYNENCGWTLGEAPFADTAHINETDAANIYTLLENEVIPTYFNREEGVPTQWISKMKNAIAQMALIYNTNRMMEEYYARFYSPMYSRYMELKANKLEKMQQLAAWKNKVQTAWPKIRVESVKIHDSSNEPITLGRHYNAEIQLHLDGLEPDDIAVEIVFIKKREEKSETEIIRSEQFKFVDLRGDTGIYRCSVQMTESGVYEHGFRFYPQHKLLAHRQDFPLMKWV